MSRPAPGAVDYGLLVALSVIWGSAFLLSKIAVADFSPITITLARQIVAVALLVVFALIAGQRWFRPTGRDHALMALAAVTGVVLPYTLINWGVVVIDSGLAAILMGLMPLTVLVLAHMTTADEKLTVAKLAGVSLGLVGLVVLFWPSVVAGFGQDLWRQLAVLGAAFAYAVNALAVKRLVHHPPLVLMTYVTVCSVVLLVPLTVLVEDPFAATPTTASVLALIALGVVPSAIGALFMVAIIARQGASFFGQINLLVPVAGVLIGVVFAGERPGLNALIALIIIIAGMVVARLNPVTRPAPAKESHSS